LLTIDTPRLLPLTIKQLLLFGYADSLLQALLLPEQMFALTPPDFSGSNSHLIGGVNYLARDCLPGGNVRRANGRMMTSDK